MNKLSTLGLLLLFGCGDSNYIETTHTYTLVCKDTVYKMPPTEQWYRDYFTGQYYKYNVTNAQWVYLGTHCQWEY
jgi:hypothetical protein